MRRSRLPGSSPVTCFEVGAHEDQAAVPIIFALFAHQSFQTLFHFCS